MEEPNTLIIMVGPPGCGKSTLAADMAKKMGYFVVSSDKVREDLYGDEAIQGDPTEVFNKVYKRIDELGRRGESVIYDATNCIRKYRTRLVRKYKGVFAYILCVYYDGTLDKCLENNENRDKHVPEDVIKRLYLKYEEGGLPDKSEGFDLLLAFDYFAQT